MDALLNYKKYGEEGRVMVILHGLFGMLDNWNSFARHLASHCQVYIVDQRNHGRSFHSDEMSYSLMADDLKRFLLQNKLEEITLMGHSMGGKVAMYFALTYQEFIRQLIVVDIAPKSYQPKHHTIFSALRSIDLTANPTRTDIAHQLSQKIHSPAIIQFLMKNLRRNRQMQLAWKMNLKGIYEHYEEMNKWEIEGRVFEGEVLFIKGANSDYILDSDKEVIQKYFPHAEIITIEGAGHWVHAEKPKVLWDVILRFVC
ncbi:MAG TPA: alpha/beta fold hydrolase [Saprospiraceae bacterium]|nr:alpha/beta fold hydrolase [Saprospiraceae bacterium]